MKLYFNFYNSVTEAFIHKDDVSLLSFNEAVELLQSCNKKLNIKEDGHLFNFCSYKKKDYETPSWTGTETRNKNDLIRRCKNNVDKIYCLLLDVDGTKTLSDVINEWHDYEYLIYSTFGNSTSKEKFRLIVPLEVPLTNKEFDSRHTAMCKEFNVDNASFTISQAFYFPSYNDNNEHLQFFYHHEIDRRYNALDLEAEPIYNYKINDNIGLRLGVDPTADLVYRSVLKCSNLHYADVLSLATLFKSKGLTLEHFRTAVFTIASADSSLRTDEVDLNKIWLKGYERITHRKATTLLQRLGCKKMPWYSEK